ncbi:phage tail protein [Pseudoalteromonas sp. MMG013]|uniref:phage late control D family protein n=1 Tax=Pseudoalteromonas sp. MMG013 TaxID=2822687 RepID=UPI001B39130C|nr:contractile injection system protein, VgrG/Pvc8 family [Pseudoalteromonas sp. MMG013]MBQ4862928.1 phage tail protein [Pseudoalteromonas sp. MMG013]
MNLQPQFSIKANGNEVAERLRDRMVEVRVSLKTGLQSDACYVRFDNLGTAPIQNPKPTDIVEIAMGYKNGAADKAAKLIPLGSFEVGEYSVSGPIRSLELFGNKVLWHTGLKAPKQKSWPADPNTPQKLGDLVSDIASEHGLDPKVGAQFSAIELPHIEQSESDLQLLSKLAEQYDAILKIAHDKLIFMGRGTGKSLSGKPLKEVDIDVSQILSWHFMEDAYRTVGEVKAYFYDMNEALRKPVTAGSGQPAIVLPYVYANEAYATQAAKGKHERLNRAAKSIRAKVIGDPAIGAGAVVNLIGTGTLADGKWYVSEVDHIINSEGFASDLLCEQVSS